MRTCGSGGGEGCGAGVGVGVRRGGRGMGAAAGPRGRRAGWLASSPARVRETQRRRAYLHRLRLPAPDVVGAQVAQRLAVLVHQHGQAGGPCGSSRRRQAVTRRPHNGRHVAPRRSSEELGGWFDDPYGWLAVSAQRPTHRRRPTRTHLASSARRLPAACRRRRPAPPPVRPPSWAACRGPAPRRCPLRAAWTWRAAAAARWGWDNRWVPTAMAGWLRPDPPGMETMVTQRSPQKSVGTEVAGSSRGLGHLSCSKTTNE